MNIQHYRLNWIQMKEKIIMIMEYLELNYLNMGLNRRQLCIFRNKRIFTIIILENIPQLIMQLIYSINIKFKIV